jgi:IS4 transposase
MSSLYDLKSAKFIHLEEFSGVTSDQILGTKTMDLIKEGDLLLRDLGYLKVKDLMRINDIGAYFLSRLSGSMSIYETQNGESIPFSILFEKYNTDGLLDMNIYLGKEKLLTRIVAYIVPEAVANKRRWKLNKNAKGKGRKISAENATRQNFSIYVTNVPKEIWPVEIVQTVYRLRWQIELIFRSWKSQLKIHVILGTDENRIRLLLYAKWFAIILCATVHELVIWYAENILKREASFHKTINYFLLQKRFEDLLKNPEKIIKQLLKELRNGWLKDKKGKKISTKEMIKNRMPSYL